MNRVRTLLLHCGAAALVLALSAGCEGIPGPAPDPGNGGGGTQPIPGGPNPGLPNPGKPNPGDDVSRGGTGVNFPGVIDLINEKRRAAGAPVMKRAKDLEPTAKKCAISNMDASPPGGLHLSHSLPGCGYENLFASSATTTTASQIVTTWMNSPGHRRAMLDPSMTKIAVGHASQAGKGIFVAARFGR